MWYTSLYYSRTKSRQTPTGLYKPDLQLFMYLCNFIENNQRNINVGTTDGVAREYAKYLHCENLNDYM